MFRKKLINKILSVFLLLVLFLNLFINYEVNATDTPVDGVSIEYGYYDSKGWNEGSVLLTTAMNDAEHWVLFADELDNIYYYSDGNSKFYMNYWPASNRSDYWMYSSGSYSYYEGNLQRYNKSTKTWSTFTLFREQFNVNDGYFFSPNGVIASKGMSFYMSAGTSYPVEILKYEPSLPFIENFNDICLNEFEYLDVNLQDCYNYPDTGDAEIMGYSDYWNFTFNSVSVSIYEKSTGSIVYDGNFSDVSNSYFSLDDSGIPHLKIPKTDMLEFAKGTEYEIYLNTKYTVNHVVNNDTYLKFNFVVPTEHKYSFTSGVGVDGGGSDEDQDPTQGAIDTFTNSVNEQNEYLKENNETNKNIFQKIGDIFNILNPFSEDFFAYKLIDLLLDALKSLFIPGNEFFSNYFNELNDWFADRFGFLYYPLELFFDLCDRFLNINFNEPIIDIPEIREPSTNTILINATQYNFNSLLEEDSLKTVHDIYLIIVDAIIYIGLVLLLYKKYEEVMTK